MSYALYHLTVNGRTVELSHRDELPWPHIVICDQWLESHRERQLYRYRRDRLAELKETHGCGYRPRIGGYPMTTKTKLRRPARSAVLVASVEIRALDGRVVGASVATGKTAAEAIKAAAARLPEVP